MTKITVICFAAAALFLGGCSKGNGVDANTQAEIDARLAEITSIADEGVKFAEEQLKTDSLLQKSKSGLIYKITTEGTGDTFKETDKVEVIYTGKHVDGTEFDSSKGEYVEFPVNGVVPGFKEMLMKMRHGAKAYCIIPAELGYGDRGAGDNIAPGETLVFEIETK